MCRPTSLWSMFHWNCYADYKFYFSQTSVGYVCALQLRLYVAYIFMCHFCLGFITHWLPFSSHTSLHSFSIFWEMFLLCKDSYLKLSMPVFWFFVPTLLLFHLNLQGIHLEGTDDRLHNLAENFCAGLASVERKSQWFVLNQSRGQEVIFFYHCYLVTRSGNIHVLSREIGLFLVGHGGQIFC